MDDFNVNVLSEAKNEYSSRLVTILTPLIIEGIKSIFKEAYELCNKNDETNKYLMTFQNFLTRIPRWNQQIINEETKRIIQRSRCSYLEDILTCVHITQLKILTSIRVSSRQKKVSIDIPKLPDFIHKVYIEMARKLYENVYLFEARIVPLQQQKNMRECEIICRECILAVVQASMPIEQILRAYIDQDEEEEIVQELVSDPITPDNTKDSAENVSMVDSSANHNSSVVAKVLSSSLTPTVTTEQSAVSSIKEKAKDVNLSDIPVKKEDSADPKLELKSVASMETLPTLPEEKSPVSAPSPSSAAATPGPPKSSKSDNLTIKTEKAHVIPVKETNALAPSSLSFSPKDKVMHYKTTDKVTQMKAADSKIVTAPKTLERLEQLSQIRHDQRKMEDEEEDDEGQLTIHSGSSPALDALDIQVLDSKLELQKPPILTGIEVL